MRRRTVPVLIVATAALVALAACAARTATEQPGAPETPATGPDHGRLSPQRKIGCHSCCRTMVTPGAR
jgi:hypothetical protein